MPFLHNHNRTSFIAQREQSALKTGHRPYVQLGRSRYAGGWLNNQKHGFGLDHGGRDRGKHPERVYEGTFREHQRNGFGILRHACANGNGRWESGYVGQWRADLRHGEGKQYYKNGNCYWGGWKAGKRHGLGMLWSEGGMYVGEWKVGKYDGAGVLFQPNGNRYEGSFRNGMKHGEGTFYHINSGQLQKGVWLEDKCVTSIMQDELRQWALWPTEYPITRDFLDSPDELVRRNFRAILDSIGVVVSNTSLGCNMCGCYFPQCK